MSGNWDEGQLNVNTDRVQKHEFIKRIIDMVHIMCDISCVTKYSNLL